MVVEPVHTRGAIRSEKGKKKGKSKRKARQMIFEESDYDS